MWTQKTSGLDLLGYVPNDTNFSLNTSTLEQNKLEAFGENFDVDKKGDVLIASTMYTSTYELDSSDGSLLYPPGEAVDSSLPNVKVVVYRRVNDQYTYSQILEPFNQFEDFGNSIAISNDGKKIAVGAPLNSDLTPGGGCVYIFVQNGTTFSYRQTIRPRDTKPNTQFGHEIDFDGNTLAIVPEEEI